MIVNIKSQAMKTALKLLFFLSFSSIILAQGDSVVVTAEYLSLTEETIVDQFDDSRQSQYIRYFPMKYARFVFSYEDREFLDNISDTIVERIDLVYTVFRRDTTFDQVKLNKTRYEMLQYFFPAAFRSNLIEWRLVAQEGAADYETARGYFHGFVVYLKPHRVTTESGEVITTVDDERVDDPMTKILETSDEVERVKRSLEMVFGATKTKVVKETVEKWETKKTWTGYYLHHNPKKRGKGKKYKKKGRKERPKEYFNKKVKVREVVEKTVKVPGDPEATVSEALGKITTDTVVHKTFKENFEKWDDYVLVQDVTGSMYPYLTQTLIYLKMHMKGGETEKFAFFNDGDAAPDGLIGRSGGVYYVSANNAGEIEQTAYNCMAGGKGGKAPENDIEAILYAMKRFPNCKGAVLIADNYSRVRDIVLLKKLVEIGKPIDVVICESGKKGEVNIDYLYLAKMTGGTIHTLDASYEDLENKGDGDFFKVGSQTFQMEGKTIKLVRD